MISSEERITEPQLRGGGTAPAGWERGARGRRGRARAPRAGGSPRSSAARPPTRRPTCQRIVREALGSPHVRPRRARRRRALARALSPPELGASIADIDTAESVLLVGADPLHAMPILDLRLRKAVRHSNLRAGGRLRPPDGPRRRRRGDRPLPARRAGGVPRQAGCGARRQRPERGRGLRAAGRRAAPGQDAGDLGRGPRPRAGRAAAWPRCSRSARRSTARPTAAALLGPRRRQRARRSARSAACRRTGPGFARADAGRGLEEIKRGLHEGELDGVILVHADPVRDLPDGPGWAEALRRAAPWSRSRASTTPRPRPPTSSSRPRPTPRRRARSPTRTAACSACAPPSPARAASARSGRCWRSSPRPSATRPASTPRPKRSRRSPRRSRSTPASPRRRSAARGVRWQEREAAAAFPARVGARLRRSAPAAPADADGGLRLGTYRDLWAGGGHRAQPGAAVPRPRSSGSSSRPPTRSGSGWRTATRSRSAPTARACGRGWRCASACAPAPGS